MKIVTRNKRWAPKSHHTLVVKNRLVIIKWSKFLEESSPHASLSLFMRKGQGITGTG